MACAQYVFSVVIVTHGGRCLPPSGSTAGSALSPTPPQGGVILERLMQASYHSPLEGESQKPSRQAKADAVGGRTPARQTAARGFAALSKSTPTGAGGGF